MSRDEFGKNSYSIISDNRKVEAELNPERIKAAVLVHLYYEEQVDIYKSYLEKVPYFIDIIIISSKDTVLERFSPDRFRRVKKENRGRDISALLVAAKDIVFQYEYICFIHDKKERSAKEKTFVDLWRKNLWDNMLQSDIYVYNILELLESDRKIGLLVPLPPHRGDGGIWLRATWNVNYENTKRLADELGIMANICSEKPPFTYGTVFWARTQALKKLYIRDWQYTDFPDEPMGVDGEISHAIERILQYVAEDAGYRVKIALSSSFAESLIGQLYDETEILWKQMKENFGIRDYKELINYNCRIEKLKSFRKQYSDIYLYGGGKKGRECLKMCQLLDIFPKGIIVTNIESQSGELDGVPIVSICDVRLKPEMGIVISVGNNYREEIIEELEKRKFYQYQFYD